MQDMVIKTNKGLCPKCRRNQWIVVESETTIYLTDRDGNIVDSKESARKLCSGKCTNCGAEYDMLSLHEKFVPIPPIIKSIGDYSLLVEPDDFYDYAKIDNPMEKNNE
jgi:hypothetical protein